MPDSARWPTRRTGRAPSEPGGRHVGQEAIPLHDGIAMTADYSVGNVVAHLTWLDHLLGHGHHQLGQLAGALAS